MSYSFYFYRAFAVASVFALLSPLVTPSPRRLLTGGELFDTIIAKGHYSEADARAVTTTLLSSIKYDTSSD